LIRSSVVRRLPLGDLVDFPTSRTPTSSPSTQRSVLTFKGLRPAGEFDLDEPVTPEEALAAGMVATEVGDTVATAQGHASGWILKKVGHVNESTTQPFAAATLQVFRPRTVAVNDRYLFHTLRAPEIYEQVRHLAGTRKSLTPKQLSQVTIPVPPLEDQHRIASILDAADALRSKRGQAIEKLDTLKQSIFLDMFGDPVNNPTGWPKSPLSGLGNVVTGKTPPSARSGMFGDEVPFVTPGDLESNDRPVRWLSREGASHSRVVVAGSTLVCCIGATIGKVGEAATDCAFNQQINAVEWDRNVIIPTYGTRVMKSLRQEIARLGASTTLPLLNKTSFAKVSIPVPPMKLQVEFQVISEALDKCRTHSRVQDGAFEQLFASLQQRAFRGDL
jgi:type I restriction enzyme S subunit